MLKVCKTLSIPLFWFSAQKDAWAIDVWAVCLLYSMATLCVHTNREIMAAVKVKACARGVHRYYVHRRKIYMVASIPTAADARLHAYMVGVMRGRTCEGLLTCMSKVSLRAKQMHNLVES